MKVAPVKRLPPSGSEALRRLMGMETGISSTRTPWCSWKSRSAPIMPAM